MAFASILVGLLLAVPAGAATVTVTATSDDLTPNDGSVSLREAITAINAGNDLGDPDIAAQNPGTFGTNDTIHFNIPGAGQQVIVVGTYPGARAARYRRGSRSFSPSQRDDRARHVRPPRA